jgi:hypothetical protein
MAQSTFNINLVNQGGNATGGGSIAPPWARDPNTGMSLARWKPPAGAVAGPAAGPTSNHPNSIAAFLNSAKSMAGHAGFGQMAGLLGKGAGLATSLSTGGSGLGGLAGAIMGGTAGVAGGGGALGGMAGALGGGMGGALAGGPATIALAPLLLAGVLFKGAVGLFQKGVAHFVARAEVLSQYSGAISAAQASADVRRITTDIREASAVGTDTGRLIDAQSRFQTSFDNAILPIKEFLVERLATIMEKLADWMDYLSPRIEGGFVVLKAIMEAIIQFANFDWKGGAAILRGIVGKLEDIAARKPGAEENMPLEQMLRMLEGGQGDDALRKRAEQKANQPAFVGFGPWRIALPAL